MAPYRGDIKSPIEVVVLTWKIDFSNRPPAIDAQPGDGLITWPVHTSS